MKRPVFFSVGDIDELTDKITYLFEHYEESIRMGKQAKIVAEDRWNRNIVAEKTMNAYRKVLSMS